MATQRITSKLTRNNNHNADRRAVVIGGSMAGMLAARVLAEHYERVTVIERDSFPEGPESRPGTPQARHLHGLMLRGRQIIEQLFPGLNDELVAAGAINIDAGSDIAWHTPGGWGVNFRSGLEVLAFTRDLLDWAIRRRLKQFDNVRFVEECDVTGLLGDEVGRGVDGVRVRFRHLPADILAGEKELRADLVVDATGRASGMPQWLEALGYEAPAETVVNAHLGYASRLYRIPAGFKADWKAVFLQAAPPDRTRAGIIFPVEGDRWILTLGGGDRDYPPTDEAGFRAFARSLWSPLIASSISGAEPLSPIYGNRSTQNRLRHYEHLKRWPERLIVIGDSVCAFNPVYGQGMTTAAMGALELDRCLREQRRRHPDGDLTGMARRFQRKLARINAAAWMLATGEDYRYRGTEGGTPDRMTRFMHRYMDQIFRLSSKNTRVRRAFLEVQQMIKSPAALFHPGIVARVLWQTIKPWGNRREAAGVASGSRQRVSETA
ncbi:MAG TPA: FAD-dependent monooxygenase [Blastocatellia bacterium]|nr:FAD-dependent monooxygenase [Blastocatellia bacterium]